MYKKAARKKKPLKITQYKKNSLKRQKNNRLASFGFLIPPLVISVFIVFFGFLYKKVTVSFASAQNVDSVNLNEKDIYSILIFSSEDVHNKTANVEKLKLIVIDKKDKEIKTFSINSNTTGQVPGKFGEEKLVSVLTLANSAHSEKRNALDFFVKTVENKVNFKIDRYIYVSTEKFSTIEKLFTQKSAANYMSFLAEFGLSNMNGNLISNISDRELYSIFEFLFSDPIVLQKGDKIQQNILETTLNSNVAEEQLMISVLNGSKKTGVALYGAEVAELKGGRVTFVGNAKQTYNESIIVTDNPDSQTVKYLKDYFNVKKIEEKSKFSYLESDVERADVTLIIGLDFVDNIY